MHIGDHCYNSQNKLDQAHVISEFKFDQSSFQNLNMIMLIMMVTQVELASTYQRVWIKIKIKTSYFNLIVVKAQKNMGFDQDTRKRHFSIASNSGHHKFKVQLICLVVA